jgi:hypothetical protein
MTMNSNPGDETAIHASGVATIVRTAAVAAESADSIGNEAGIDGIINAISATAKTATAEGGGGGNRHAPVVLPTTAQGQEGVDFPSWYLCSFIGSEPPVDGAYFDVPSSTGLLFQQVFEYSSLYRYIATQGMALRAMQSVLHPISGGWI